MVNQDKVRLIVDIPIEDAFLINDIAIANKTNRTTAIVKALRTLDLIDSEVSKGATVEIVAADGTVRKLIFK